MLQPIRRWAKGKVTKTNDKGVCVCALTMPIEPADPTMERCRAVTALPRSRTKTLFRLRPMSHGPLDGAAKTTLVGKSLGRSFKIRRGGRKPSGQDRRGGLGMACCRAYLTDLTIPPSSWERVWWRLLLCLHGRARIPKRNMNAG